MIKHELEAPFFSKDEEVQGPTIGGVCFGTQKGLYLNITGQKVKEWTVKATVPFNRRNEAGYPLEEKRKIVANYN